jgi:predicted GNAT family N-acyltransferase
MTEAEFSVASTSWAADHETLSHIRFTVFVREQGVPPEIELDSADADTMRVIHAIARSAGGQAIGTARLLLDQPIPRIGRMAVLKAWRGAGVGHALLEHLCNVARDRGFVSVRLFAQMHATPFYYREGFLSHGAEFTEAGIPHLEMRRAL